ncbi:AAA family ATPase [Sulfobacillus harzensis]|uniref:P-loop NTPase n=1 Tax=Sulfobacillus harzensis TaxID=2729629 RepID=A0A7Y0Q3N1_9FIRM|nr:P-loop NTPase [Sulfobacillus harzensis]NMP24438.1 P-loop NTPase [Sulfobacillus harzensis]
MLTVHVLALPDMMGAVSLVLADAPDVEVELRTNNLREVLGYRFADSDHLLIIDDRLLSANPGLVGSVAALPCQKLLVGNLKEADTARRALTLEAVNLLGDRELAGELPRLLASLQEPPEAPRDGLVLSVYSAKGGVGKSTVALNLAWALALQSSQAVALVDCDPLGDIGAMIQDKPGATVADAVRGIRNGLDPEKTIQSLHRVKGLNLTILPAASTLAESELVDAEGLDTLIRLVRSHHAYVVMDLPTGLTDLNLTAMDLSSRIMVLAAPERVTLGTVSRGLDLLSQFYGDRIAVALNRADSDTGLSQAEAADILGMGITMVLPSGGAGPVRAANRGRPLVLAEPKNPLARALLGLATDLVAEREGVRRRPRRWLGAKVGTR